MDTVASPAMNGLDAYREMLTIRRFEEAALELSRAGEISGSIHLCMGQEAIPVGTMRALAPQDRVITTYRGHGWALACGVAPLALMAEILHRADGLNGGRAGSALLSAPDAGFLGENSIVGAGVPIASGVALAATLQGTNRVVVVSIGDGAMNQGATTEGMVFAAARNLPVVFICENNGWSEMTPISLTTRGTDLARRGEGLGIESHVVDGNDPEAVRDAVTRAADLCRRGDGPVLLECKTVRLGGHYNRDIEHYRSDGDREAAQARDPLTLLSDTMTADERAKSEEIDVAVTAEVARVVDEARGLPFADKHSATEHLYAAPESRDVREDSGTTRTMTYFRAINTALDEAMSGSGDVVVFGEDVGAAGGIFGVTRGLQKRFGADRVFDTPIAEAAILGAAVGASIEGLRPVVEIMWADFAFVALDQIVNQAANVRYINRGRLSAPVTIRMQQGVTPGSCAQHSQSIEAILAHVPGLKVGLPATPADAYEMTRAAIADPDPTILIEHRAMYLDEGSVTVAADVRRAEGARLRRNGSDVGIVAWGAAVPLAMEAADTLALRGVDAAVLDLRWLRPLDEEALASLVTTVGGRIVVAHQAHAFGGFGGEIAAHIAECHFVELAGPVRRVGTAASRIPAAPHLQEAILPSADDIAAAVVDVMRG